MFADLEVECENTTFICHSLILALASDFFLDQLKCVPHNSKPKRIEIVGIKPEIMKYIFHYIYDGKVRF